MDTILDQNPPSVEKPPEATNAHGVLEYSISPTIFSDILSVYSTSGWQKTAKKIHLMEPSRNPWLSSDKEVLEWIRVIYRRMALQHGTDEDWQLFTADLRTQEKTTSIRKIRELFCSCVAKIPTAQQQKIEESILQWNAIFLESVRPGTLSHFITENIPSEKQLALCVKDDKSNALMFAQDCPTLYDSLINAALQLMPQEIVALCSNELGATKCNPAELLGEYNHLIQKAPSLAINKIHILCKYLIYTGVTEREAYRYLVDHAHLLPVYSLEALAHCIALPAFKYLLDHAATLPENKIEALREARCPLEAYRYIVDNAHALSHIKLRALCMCTDVDIEVFTHLIDMAPTLPEKTVIAACSKKGSRDWTMLQDMPRPTLLGYTPPLSPEQAKALHLEDKLASLEYEIICAAMKVISEV